MELSELHIWHASLHQDDALLDSFFRSLSDEERSRAARFKFDIHRNRFIAARGMLRGILGEYLRLSPEAIQFETTERGKPYLCASQNRDNIRFNLSHSGDRAVYAVALDSEIGIDIEVADKPHNGLGISRSYFTEKETASLQHIDSEKERLFRFLNLWTRKEACIKCTGDGLGAKLDSFDVSAVSSEPTAVAFAGNILLVSDLFDASDACAGAVAYPDSCRFQHIHKQWLL